jgi:hypothetical protein
MNRLPLLVGLLALLAFPGAALANPAPQKRGETGATGGEARLLHVAPSERRVEQGILTAVPITVDVPVDLDAARVLVHFKVHGSKDWTTLELYRESGQRFRGAIPCLEVSTITGDLRYYVRVHDADGAVIAYRGSRSEPFVVRVIHESERPDLKSGGRCPDPADCPRGLPGCPSEEVERAPCKSDADCEGVTTCSWEGFCEIDERRKNWLSLGISGTLGLVPGAGACTLHSQENEGYACYRQRDGARYLGEPVYTNEPLRPARGPLRVWLGYERLVFYETTLGGRVGYTFFGKGPDALGDFLPISVEASVTRFLHDDPFARSGVAAFVKLAGGFSMLDLRGTLHVREDPTRPRVQGGNDLEQTVDVWKRAGDGYVSAGGGATFRTSLNFGVRVEVGIAQTFPFAATLVTGTVGTELGL